MTQSYCKPALDRGSSPLSPSSSQCCMLSGRNCWCLSCVNCPTFLLPCNVYMDKNSTALLTITLHTEHLPDSRQTTSACNSGNQGSNQNSIFLFCLPGNSSHRWGTRSRCNKSLCIQLAPLQMASSAVLHFKYCISGQYLKLLPL